MDAHVPQPVFLRPEAGEGEIVNDSRGHEVSVLFSHELLDVTWSKFGPHEPGATPHVHLEHTDSFYVLDGEITFRIGPELEPIRAGAGTFVAVPSNVIHGFDNDGSGNARFLNFHAPSGGFADYMRGVAPGFDSFDPPEDGGEPLSTAIVSRAGEGELLPRGNRFHRIKVQLPYLAAIELSFEPGWEGVDPHSHHDHVDSFFVLDGDIEFVNGTGGPGTFVAAPPGAVHWFRIPDGGAPISLLNIHAPDTGFTDRLRHSG
jgi:quercetin dioxygenase-like cupin family protein